VTERVTTSMTTRLILADLQAAAARLSATQRRIASGRAIAVPSDDPFAAARALELRSALDEYRQYQRNVQEARAWQAVVDGALGQISSLVLRARELLVQGASDAAGPTARAALAAEIDQIAAAVKQAANAQYAGRYVLAGTQTRTAPYDQASDLYLGDGGSLWREIGRGVRIDLSLPGSAVVGDASSGLLATLRQIASDLRSGAGAALQGPDLVALDAAHDAVTDARARIGALGNRLEAAASRLRELEESTLSILSETEDADLARTLVEYSTQQAAYQAALKAGAELIQPSLLDFLR
jgi:flagellar hook-associated protein 3 FlgL